MLIIVIKALFYFLPAYAANAMPILLAKYKVAEFLNVPVDFNIKLGGFLVFGRTKTYRGIIGGVFAALIIIILQILIYNAVPESHYLYLFQYEFPGILWLGVLMGLGEGLGDLIKSFFKRRLNLKSGTPFFPFDQMSFLGALLLSSIYYMPEFNYILAIVILSPALPIAANLIAYRLKWKKVWW